MNKLVDFDKYVSTENSRIDSYILTSDKEKTISIMVTSPLTIKSLLETIDLLKEKYSNTNFNDYTIKFSESCK